MEENNKNVATNRQIGLYLGDFEFSKNGKNVRVVEILVWSDRTSNGISNLQIIRIWDYQGNNIAVPFDTVYVSYQYIEGYKGIYKKYLGFEKYEKGVATK